MERRGIYLTKWYPLRSLAKATDGDHIFAQNGLKHGRAIGIFPVAPPT